MTATAPLEVEIRFLHSVEQPGMVCAQAFLIEQNLGQGLNQAGYRRFQQMQYSSWHRSTGAAAGDLEAKMNLLGFKKAVD